MIIHKLRVCSNDQN